MHEKGWCAGPDGEAVVDAPVHFFRTIFASGRLSAEAFAEKLGSLSVIMDAEWFQKDLPLGAEGMTEEYAQKTEQRRESPQFSAVSCAISKALGLSPDSVRHCR